MHHMPTVPTEARLWYWILWKEVEFQGLVSFCVGAGTQTWIPERAASAVDG